MVFFSDKDTIKVVKSFYFNPMVSKKSAECEHYGGCWGMRDRYRLYHETKVSKGIMTSNISNIWK